MESLSGHLGEIRVFRVAFMRQSKLFSRTQKEAPKDEVSVNAQLLTRAGFVSKLMAGVHTPFS
mgnify:CR=1 FL=1